ncbi:RNA polymerase sigma factor [Reticulibacter mediterranei]|uniref:RNA polymerase sigma factor n=1 Tax=Reticulibacter mediterranei TaxID=2778369 RepID=A0A8J3N5H9_9CHLR|nr:sigma-70 family RNA polymerase sigma factor [Reticulibacter mediterranei]GHO99307.1 RNA polymerase sigma factor [Reticulibacter mediterranei]
MFSQQQPTTEDVLTDRLYERHAAAIFTYLRQHTRSREDAEDILVDTFLAAIENEQFAQLSEQAQVAWLWRVARNKVVDSFRRASVRRGVPLELVAETLLEDEARSPEQTVVRQDLVRSLLTRLSPLQQDVMWLRFGYNLRSAEIASILGKQESAVRTMLSRTINHLRAAYKRIEGGTEQ